MIHKIARKPPSAIRLSYLNKHSKENKKQQKNDAIGQIQQVDDIIIEIKQPRN